MQRCLVFSISYTKFYPTASYHILLAAPTVTVGGFS